MRRVSFSVRLCYPPWCIRTPVRDEWRNVGGSSITLGSSVPTNIPILHCATPYFSAAVIHDHDADDF